MLTVKQLRLWKLSKSEAGRLGYQASIQRLGKDNFHSAGGQKTASMDLFACVCHGVGVFAYSQHNKLKGKKHRYAANS